MSSSTTQASSQRSIRIFCYGDSLTAGTSPPEFQEYPYAPHLERLLKGAAMVRHRGLPGWVTQQLLEDQNGQYGLVTALKTASPVSIAILLAGTNDLGYSEAPTILDNIVKLHKLCYDQGILHTVAIGIPPSAYQSMNVEAAAKAHDVNQGLAQYCSFEEKRAMYVPFPFSFEQNDDKWSPDGLHFSPKGYQILGESLAPIVQEILQKL
jgi:lysophospholipase L1-like esterase